MTNWKKYITAGLVTVAAAGLLAGCGSTDKKADTSATGDSHKIVIGLDDIFRLLAFMTKTGIS